jgi:nitroreductase
MHGEGFVPLEFTRMDSARQRTEAAAFLERMRTRRSVRDFSPDPVPMDVLFDCIRAAGLAPSGANQQPWRFVVVTSAEVRHSIRLAAEEEERENYGHRFPDEWKTVLAPLGTDWHKEFLDIAPVLIVVFQVNWGEEPGDPDTGAPRRTKHYYVTESVGIAVGTLIAALHYAGLATLTHTPNPMNFLNRILGRPRNEKPFVLLPVGYPAEGAMVPDISKKPLDEIMQLVE